MANFKDSYRLERVYFEKLKSMIGILKSFLDNENNEELRAILSNEIDENGAILLLYRNLGEAWAELADLIQKLRNDLTELDEKEEAYHDELNERIDEVNNYIMALLRELDARVTVIENEIDAFGGLPSNANAEVGDVLTVGEDHVNIWKKCECLPPITYNDIGKVLGVVQDGETDPEIVETVIIPVTNLSVTDQPVPISGVDSSIFSGFNNGDTVYFLINNKRIAGEYQQGTFYCEDEIDDETVAYQIFPQGAQSQPSFISFISGTQTVVAGDYAIKLFTEESVTYPVPAYEVVAPPYMYGPYLFTTSDEETLLADSIKTVYLDAVYSYNEETQYEFPTDPNCKFYYYGHVLEESGAELNCRGVELPLVEGSSISNPVMWINNSDSTDRTLSVFYARLYLYTSVELNVYEG